MSYSRASLLFVLPAVLIVFGVMFGMNDTQTSTEWTLLPLDCGSLFFPVDDLPEACSFTRDGLVPFLAYSQGRTKPAVARKRAAAKRVAKVAKPRTGK